jgi:hypothetical protein
MALCYRAWFWSEGHVLAVQSGRRNGGDTLYVNLSDTFAAQYITIEGWEFRKEVSIKTVNIISVL